MSWSCSNGKKLYKKACWTCKFVVLLNKPIAALTFSLPLRSSLLKLANMQIGARLVVTNGKKI